MINKISPTKLVSMVEASNFSIRDDSHMMAVHQGQPLIDETMTPRFSSTPSLSLLFIDGSADSSTLDDESTFSPPLECKNTSFLILLSAGFGGLVGQ